jgi:Na+-driven multidrug efflux pump
VIDAMAGSRFDASVPVLRIQGAALFMTFMVALMSFALLSLHRYRAVLIVNAIALCTSTVLVLVLGAADGATGAAWANLVGETVLSVAGAVALAQGPDGVRLRLGSVLRVAPALAVGVVVALVVPGGALLDTVAALVACGIVLLLTRAIPEEIVAAVRR